MASLRRIASAARLRNRTEDCHLARLLSELAQIKSTGNELSGIGGRFRVVEMAMEKLPVGEDIAPAAGGGIPVDYEQVPIAELQSTPDAPTGAVAGAGVKHD